MSAGRDVGQVVPWRLARSSCTGREQIERGAGGHPGRVATVELAQVVHRETSCRWSNGLAGEAEHSPALGGEEGAEVEHRRMGIRGSVAALVELHDAVAGLGVVEDRVHRRIQVIEVDLRPRHHRPVLPRGSRPVARSPGRGSAQPATGRRSGDRPPLRHGRASARRPRTAYRAAPARPRLQLASSARTARSRGTRGAIVGRRTASV